MFRKPHAQVPGTSDAARPDPAAGNGPSASSNSFVAGGATALGRGAEPKASTPDGGILGLLVGLGEELWASAGSLAEVYSDRARLALRRKVTSIALAAGAAVALLFAVCAAALAAVRGLCGAVAELCGGRAWAGDLAGGLLAIALVAGLLAWHTKRSARSELERLKAKYERLHGPNPDRAAPGLPTEDGRGVAGSRGSTGAAAARHGRPDHG